MKTLLPSIISELNKIITPYMQLTAYVDLLELLLVEVGFDGEQLSLNVDLINYYYNLLQESESEHERLKIVESAGRDGIKSYFLSEFFIIFEKDIETMTGQSSQENEMYFKDLVDELYDPVKVTREVTDYVRKIQYD